MVTVFERGGGPYLDDVTRAYMELNQAKAEGREPDFEGIPENAVEQVEKAPVATPVFPGQELQRPFIVENVKMEYVNPDNPAEGHSIEIVDPPPSVLERFEK